MPMIKPELAFVYEAGGELDAPREIGRVVDVRPAQQVDLCLRWGGIRQLDEAVGPAGVVKRVSAATFALLLLPGNVDYQASRTAWGDPDLTGTWPVQTVWDAQIRLERPKEA